jgi:tetraacyldisaccharide 4'-kinase
VLRGYGDDEPRVHARTNPDVPVIVAADRVSGIDEAAKAGANVAVLDDAFQHRRAARDADIVLISADGFSDDIRTLPAGPYREPLSALTRATAVVVTTKAASPERLSHAVDRIQGAAAGKPVAVARLSLDKLIRETGPRQVLDAGVVRNKTVLAIAAVGNPGAFFQQLTDLRALVTEAPFADHHAFSIREIRDLASAAEAHDYVICTLKDAVKLGPMWPATARPLWYVSLAVAVERGSDALDRILNELSKPNGT